jgi:hypothetical protein
VLGDVIDDTGAMLSGLARASSAVQGAAGMLWYPVPPDPRFLRWCVEHPDRLVWPAGRCCRDQEAVGWTGANRPGRVLRTTGVGQFGWDGFGAGAAGHGGEVRGASV